MLRSRFWAFCCATIGVKKQHLSDWSLNALGNDDSRQGCGTRSLARCSFFSKELSAYQDFLHDNYRVSTVIRARSLHVADNNHDFHK